MLQALKHRGPDSTGYALYGEGSKGDYIMRFKVGENVKKEVQPLMKTNQSTMQEKNK
jgi:glutamate synthase domain-containing protein 1